MSIDPGRIAAVLNSAWETHGGWIILTAAGFTALLVAVAIVVIVRSKQRDRWVSGLTALVVLAWTSEGLWEVARHTLGLPIGFAIMTFFVFEAMMVTSAMQAERHRNRHGSPGPAGQYVWVLATLTAVVVALNASTRVEAVLRFALPLAAAGLWWVGVTAERDSDDDDVRQRRAEAQARREAEWAITPTVVLVWAKIKRPGAVSVTAGERERRIQKMVKAADRHATAEPGSRTARRSLAKLRKLARLATAKDVADVAARVARTTGIAALVFPATPAATAPVHADILAAEWPANSDADDRPDEPEMAAPSGRRGRPNRAAKRGQKRPTRGQDRVAMAADIVANQPDIPGSELAERFGLKPRSGRRLKANAEQFLAALGQWPPAGQAAAMTAANSNGHPTATEADTTAGGGAS